MCPSAVQGQLLPLPWPFFTGEESLPHFPCPFGSISGSISLLLEDPRSRGKVIIRSAREKEAMRFKRWSTGLVGKKIQWGSYVSTDAIMKLIVKCHSKMETGLLVLLQLLWIKGWGNRLALFCVVLLNNIAGWFGREFKTHLVFFTCLIMQHCVQCVLSSPLWSHKKGVWFLFWREKGLCKEDISPWWVFYFIKMVFFCGKKSFQV